MKQGDKVFLSTLHLNIPIPGGVRKFKQPYTGPFTVLEVKSSGSAVVLDLPAAWTAASTWNVQYLKPYHPTSSPEFSESALSLSNIAVSDDSIKLTSDANDIGKPSPMSDVAQLPVTHELYTPPSVASPILGPYATSYQVARIDDFRPARGKKPAQYFLVFHNQPASESTWVNVDECNLYQGFDSALQVHQNRRTLRSAVRS